MDPVDGGCAGCRTSAVGREGCPVHGIIQHTWTSAGPIMTHCQHGLDLRTYPRCFLCRPLSEAEMQNWLRSQPAF